MTESMSNLVKGRVQTAARVLKVVNPLEYVGALIDRSFPLPVGDDRYAKNALIPGALAFEPSFSEREPNSLRFTIEPLGPGASPGSRQMEAGREMRRLVGNYFGREALRWFDSRSEDWRGFSGHSGLNYGAWFGNAYDRDGLAASKVYYEFKPNQIEALPARLAGLVRLALDTMPALTPLFTTIACRREAGSQRVSFGLLRPLRLTELAPLMQRMGLAHQLPSMMQIVGLTLGGRFDLPAGSALLGIGDAQEGPELKLEVLLGRVPDLPPSFLDLLALGLTERPRQLQALTRWLQAFTPESYDWPGDFTVMSIRTTNRTPARVALYLCPVEFELRHTGRQHRA